MDTGKIEILLIEMSGASIRNRHAWRHSLFRSAPIGLYCLKSIAPERVGIIDVPISQITDMLGVFSKSPIKAVICRLSEEPDSEFVLKTSKEIRNAFPNAKVGCNFTKSDVTKEFDFIINGTGKTSVLRILRGDTLLGLCDDIKNDLTSYVEVPSEPLSDVGYNVLPEKWLSVHNLEVSQPWLGLAEFNTSLYTYPGLEWMTRLFCWLKDSGFDAFHLTPAKYTAEELNRLRATIIKLGINLSISFLSVDNIRFSEILIPLKQIWLYYPLASGAEDVIQKLKSIKEAGFEACMQIEYNWYGGGVTLPACKYIDHIVIYDDYKWSNFELKKFTQRFWGTKTRFFKRLFSLRSASELIIFMKISYALLETLFLPDKKGE